MASRERMGSGRKGRGTEWDEVGKKDMYTTREEIREKKKWAPPGAGWFPGWNFAERRALPPKAAGRERKGGRKGEKCVYSICLLFPLFFVHLYKHKKGWFFCAYLYVYTKKKKNVYVKLHTANKAGVMRAYVYVCILRKCSGWFRCTDFRKFCAGLFAYFFCWQPCGRQSLRAAGEVCMFICTKKKTKCICLHTQKKEQNVYVYVCKI